MYDEYSGASRLQKRPAFFAAVCIIIIIIIVEDKMMNHYCMSLYEKQQILLFYTYDICMYEYRYWSTAIRDTCTCAYCVFFVLFGLSGCCVFSSSIVQLTPGDLCMRK